MSDPTDSSTRNKFPFSDSVPDIRFLLLLSGDCCIGVLVCGLEFDQEARGCGHGGGGLQGQGGRPEGRVSVVTGERSLCQ